MIPDPASVIVFAGALYDSPLWTNRQQVATRLAERGWRVLYVEPRLFLPRMLFGPFPGSVGRWPWLLRHLIPMRPRPNLWVLAQSNRIPGSRRWPAIGRLNHVLYNAWNVRWHAWRLGFKQPALLLYDTEAAEFLDDFPASTVVYDCVDDHHAEAAAHGRNPALVELEEAAIVGRAAAIAVTVESLRERFARVHRSVHLVENAADVGAFLKPPAVEPADISGIPHPRVGTVGALDTYKLDVPLLAEVIRAHPDWQFVFVGPVEFASARYPLSSIISSFGVPAILPNLLSLGKADLPGQGRLSGQGRRPVQSLCRFPNVHFLGPKPREQVPAYIHAFDVAMIPYRESSYNRASFPLKFWEFLASGKPTVASGLPALEPYARLADLPKTPEAFARALEQALADPESARSARQAEAARHGWETRVEAMEELLRNALTVGPTAKKDKKYRVP